MKMKAKILIVDDEQINLEFFDVMLSKLGFQVEKAEDGEEALDRVRSFKPNLIILDNIMPKLSGWEVTKILKQHEEYREFRSIPIIMFSAMDDVKDKIEGFDLGVEDYITKPFNFSEVLARIKAVLRHKEFTDQMKQRERRIALLESLNASLFRIMEAIRQPIEQIIAELEEAPTEERKKCQHFATDIENHLYAIQRMLKELDERVQELQGRENDLRKQEVSLKELEDRYQKHFNR